MTAILGVLIGVASTAVVLVCLTNRAIDNSTRLQPRQLPAVRPHVTPCPVCSGPLTISQRGVGDATQLVGRASCSGCGLRLELTDAA